MTGLTFAELDSGVPSILLVAPAAAAGGGGGAMAPEEEEAAGLLAFTACWADSLSWQTTLSILTKKDC